MKKNNGFTLIELMAVIIILGVIGLIVFPTALDSINNSKEKLYKEQVKRILDAAESWAADNDSLLPDAEENSTPIMITIDYLQKAGLLKKDDVKNPISGTESMAEKIVIYYDNDYKQYTAVYCDTSEENSKLYYTDEIERNNVLTKCNSVNTAVTMPNN